MCSQDISNGDIHIKIMESCCESEEMRKQYILDYLCAVFNLSEDEDGRQELSNYMRRSFFHIYFRKWRDCRRINERFLQANKIWLEKKIAFSPGVYRNLQSTSSGHTRLQGISRGRPQTSFDESSERSKRRKTETLRANTDLTQLPFATVMSFRANKNDAAAKLIKEANSPTRAKEILHKWKSDDKNLTKLSAEEGVSLIITAHLTKHQYFVIRNAAKEHYHDLYPSYHDILKAKSAAYPEDIVITEQICEVKLQSLLNHTIKRIFQYLQDFDTVSTQNSLSLICKWGFDGSSSQSRYKQKWTTPGVTDNSIFLTCFVPIILVNLETKETIWKNSRPSSTRYCRPIRLQWLQETSDICRQEEKYVKEQVDKLEPFVYNNHVVKFSLALTMINGKVCNALNETSSMQCYICGAKISEMNNLKSLESRPENPETMKFGIAVLHSYIKCFECILHISYRLDIKKWKTSKSDDSKARLETRKKIIQDKFKDKLGLIVDGIKPGYGTTNDGNTARRFFNNPQISAEITGVNEELITRFSNILKALSSGYEINIVTFGTYYKKTAKLYINLYPWYYMPPTIHKLLIHGSSIVKESILPIGQLSEEALEATHKYVRNFREHHTRKISRLNINEDLFKRLLLTSDPLISQLQKGDKKQNISEHVTNLLLMNEDEARQLSEIDEEIFSSSD